MGSTFETQIQKKLEGFQEQPPEKCWNALSEHLETLHQTSTTSQIPSGKGAKVSGIKAVAGSTAAKLGVGALAVSGIIAGGIWLFTPKTNHTSAPQTAQKSILITDTLTNDTPTIAVNTIVQVQQNQATSNTTFSEGIPAYLLEENESAKTTDEKMQKTPSLDSTLKPQPQATVEKTNPHSALENQSQTTYTHHTGWKETTDTEEKKTKNLSTPPKLRIPNIITPNGDNFNDYFVIENLESTERNHLVIYNRYNKIVYEQKNYDNRWNAENLPNGIYRYWLRFEYDGHEYMQQGSIKVLR